MRLRSTLIICSSAFLSSIVFSQVKDNAGNALRIGQPIKPTKDYDGGTISRARAAKCVIDADAPKACVFYPRNGNGSFAIDVDGLAYYADKLSPTKIDVDYENGARMVSQGSFFRSTRDPACWIQGSNRKICVY